MEKYLRKQAKFAYELSYKNLRKETITAVKKILLDSIGCIAKGASQLYLNSVKDTGNYTVAGFGKYFSRDLAAFINGTAMVKNEMDEGNQFAFGHPACHFFPALLTECEGRKISVEKFVEAFVAAYEISCRWGSAVKLNPNAHGHGTMQTIGAAAACGKINECSEQELYDMMILANSLPQSTTWTAAFNGDQLRNSYIGISNVIGLNAGIMNKMGIFSSIASLESVWNEVLGNGVDAERLTCGLGEKYLIESNYFKIYSACRYVHAFADLFIELMENGLKPEDIEKINLKTYKAAAHLNGQEANNAFAAKFSIPVSIALLLCKGSLSIDITNDKEVSDESVKALAKKIFVEENDEYTKLLPEKRVNSVSIKLKNGQVIYRKIIGALGDFDKPHSDKTMENKFNCLCSDIWPKDKRNLIINTISNLEQLNDINELIDMLKA